MSLKLKVNYSKQKVSKDYKCEKCKIQGVKLWRVYQSSYPGLLCANCVMSDQKKDGLINNEGRRKGKYGMTDQVGSYVPAVPCEHMDTYWGYSSVPENGCQWWRNLPTYQKDK